MSDTSDLDHQIELLRKCEIIKESDVRNLCAKAREILGETRYLLLKIDCDHIVLFQLRSPMFRG